MFVKRPCHKQIYTEEQRTKQFVHTFKTADTDIQKTTNLSSNKENKY